MIIPPIDGPMKEHKPDWFNEQEIREAAEPILKAQIRKSASSKGSEPITAQYFCSDCRKVYQADDKRLVFQKNASKNASLTCPRCGKELRIYRQVRKIEHAQPAERQIVKKAALGDAKGQTYNTYVDQVYYWKAIDALQSHVAHMGFPQARVRYISSEHTKQAGQAYPTLNTIKCAIQWEYAKKPNAISFATAKVYASVSFDEAGHINLPTVFTNAQGVQFPFDRQNLEAQQGMQREPNVGMRFDQRGGQVPVTYREREIWQFRAAAQHRGNKLIKQASSTAKEEVHEVNGQLHNTKGPAVVHKDGSKEYWFEGQLHREDGPALEGSDGFQAWYKHGSLHNTNGPAVVYANGDKEYWVDGRFVRKVSATQEKKADFGDYIEHKDLRQM